LNEAGAGLAADVRAGVEQAISAVKEASRGEDIDRIRQATQNLIQAQARLRERAAEQPTGGKGASAGPQSGGDSNVVDADFEEVDDSGRKGG
jgi:molecular chaperone DnaK